MPASEYLGFRDLVKRWGYSRQGVYKLMQLEDFPVVAFEINNGRTKVWRRVDVLPFERDHPELTSANEKHRKQVGYWRAIEKGDGSLSRPPADIDGDD